MKVYVCLFNVMFTFILPRGRRETQLEIKLEEILLDLSLVISFWS